MDIPWLRSTHAQHHAALVTLPRIDLQLNCLCVLQSSSDAANTRPCVTLAATVLINEHQDLTASHHVGSPRSRTWAPRVESCPPNKANKVPDPFAVTIGMPCCRDGRNRFQKDCTLHKRSCCSAEPCDTVLQATDSDCTPLNSMVLYLLISCDFLLSAMLCLNLYHALLCFDSALTSVHSLLAVCSLHVLMRALSNLFYCLAQRTCSSEVRLIVTATYSQS